MIRKINTFMFASILVVALSNGRVAADAFRSDQSAGIRATASVVLPLGLVTAESLQENIVSATAAAPSGSHRFWLYHPVAEGLQIQIAPSAAYPWGDTIPAFTILKEYPHVSLVQWSSLAETDPEAGPVTVTITYTNN